MTDRTCAADGCERLAFKGGVCQTCYRRRRQERSRGCIAVDCVNPAMSYGYCQTHLQRLRRGASVDAPIRSNNLRSRWRIRWDEAHEAPVGAIQCFPCAKWFVPAGTSHTHCSVKCERLQVDGVEVFWIIWCPDCKNARTVKRGRGHRMVARCATCAARAFHEKTLRSSAKRASLMANVPITGDVSVEQLRKVDGDNCHLCNKRIDFELKSPHPMSATVDHLIPLSLVELNPWHGPGNVALAHRKCNSSKGARFVSSPRLF
jgi:hypothetical protein